MRSALYASTRAADFAARSFEAFAAALHGRVPDFTKADLRDVKACAAGKRLDRPRQITDLHHDETVSRGYCGDHWRVVPTAQGLCPLCAGHVESEESVARIRDVAVSLKSAGLYDPAYLADIRARAFFHPQPHL